MIKLVNYYISIIERKIIYEEELYKIKNKHYKEAFLEGMKRQKAEIQKIVDCKFYPQKLVIIH